MSPPIASRSILVLGAGELGMPVIRNLARLAVVHDASISVMLRPASMESTLPDKRTVIDQIRSLGVALVPGDLVTATVDELADLFSGYDTVIGCTGYAAGRDTPMKVARAAVKSGITRYFPWQFGVDFDAIGRGGPQDLFDAQLDVRDYLRSQAEMDWVVISTGMFTSYLFEPEFGVIDLPGRKVNALGTASNAVTLTTPEDIGAMTAQIVFHSPPLRNEIVYLAGDTVRYEQLPAILEEKFGVPFKLIVWSVPQLMEELASDPSNMIRKYRAAFAQGRGVSWSLDGTFNASIGVKLEGVDDWLKAHFET
ncbi:TPA: aromatic alcohol reductase [Stenotrophomonas maltophilia]|uniref:aromatic alcohol reductase n=1 Tax=Stenotrophomonas maltophilia TaxID=40324 RepID=UPI000C15B63D|nr:aromatic alcohol reductase [Stenotrophomonas maltophilia]EKT4444660.1 aromatic alcohol reductase [Stenotrophomonas maltophilia]MBC9115436.1 aromatic alcohol reductase [Stenotrophomonas maltophilia]MBH1606057.1 aromatic alcohol reductase [Stenotrophomonas maltophilia]MDT3472962.1 aromatic alcohol reductase [Stenotrophomonas maltophilia]UKJ23801.1 aromatic alcohol reductase [Stenotrophomonas maltophilia]